MIPREIKEYRIINNPEISICEGGPKSPSVADALTINQKLIKEKILIIFNQLTQVLNFRKIKKKEKIL